ncbi:flagellar hook-length control protein FliK [Pontibaca methylaminivorans]|nr:flagellar hook-length control protein FliK [Pontibaca methylaminivorans]
MSDSPPEMPFELIHAEAEPVETEDMAAADQDMPEVEGELAAEAPGEPPPPIGAGRDVMANTMANTASGQTPAETGPNAAGLRSVPEDPSGEPDIRAPAVHSTRPEPEAPTPPARNTTGATPTVVTVTGAEAEPAVGARPADASPAPGAAPAAADPPDMAARPAALRQTVQAIEILIRQPSRSMEITLNPQELGHVRMTITHNGSGVNVSVLADRPETLDLLRRHVDQLAAEFLELGYAEVGFSFGADPREGRRGEDAFPDRPPPAPDEAPKVFTFIRPSADGLDLRL